MVVLALTFIVNLPYAQKTMAPKEQAVPCNGNDDDLELAEDRELSKRIFENLRSILTLEYYMKCFGNTGICKE